MNLENFSSQKTWNQINEINLKGGDSVITEQQRNGNIRAEETDYGEQIEWEQVSKIVSKHR